MNRAQIIGDAAYVIAAGRGRVRAGPQEVKDAERALTAFEVAIPGLADVIEEKAQIVPVKANKLSPSQLRTLRQISESYSDPQGMRQFSSCYSYQTLASLEKRGCLRRLGGYQSSANSPDAKANLGSALELIELGTAMLASSPYGRG